MKPQGKTERPHHHQSMGTATGGSPGQMAGDIHPSCPPPHPSRWGGWFRCLILPFSPFFFPFPRVLDKQRVVPGLVAGHQPQLARQHAQARPHGPHHRAPGGAQRAQHPPSRHHRPHQDGQWGLEERRQTGTAGLGAPGGCLSPKSTGTAAVPIPVPPGGVPLLSPLPPRHVPRLPSGEESSRGGGEGAWGGAEYDDAGDAPAN